MIVDSCLHAPSGEPAALEYLAALGVTTDNVAIVVATHWHDDHVAGLAAVVDACDGAEFYFSAMLREDEFLQLLESGRRLRMADSGVTELARIDDIYEERRRRSGRRRRLTGPNRVLWDRDGSHVRALAPSDAGVIDSMRFVAQALPQAQSGKRRIGNPGPNHTSVVLWVETRAGTALLGADLQRRKRHDLGWNAVIDLPERPQGKACIFKVPHHGARNGHDDRVWSQLLSQAPYAVLTPFTPSGLPAASDVTRICSFTSTAYLTAPGTPGPTRVRRPEVESFVGAVATRIHDAQGATGQVRVRLSPSGAHNIDLFAPADPICP
jgi:hypothetical protein